MNYNLCADVYAMTPQWKGERQAKGGRSIFECTGGNDAGGNMEATVYKGL